MYRAVIVDNEITRLEKYVRDTQIVHLHNGMWAFVEGYRVLREPTFSGHLHDSFKVSVPNMYVAPICVEHMTVLSTRAAAESARALSPDTLRPNEWIHAMGLL